MARLRGIPRAAQTAPSHREDEHAPDRGVVAASLCDALAGKISREYDDVLVIRPMPEPDTIALAAAAEKQGLESVLVGGNAVNLYAYRRTTFDVDLLVRETEAQRWISFFEQRGYRIFHRTANFVRLHFAADAAKALPVDLMLADEETFEKIRAGSDRRDVAEGVRLAVPSPLDLIAMKLHAVKSQVRRIDRGSEPLCHRTIRSKILTQLG